MLQGLSGTSSHKKTCTSPLSLDDIRSIKTFININIFHKSSVRKKIKATVKVRHVCVQLCV